MKRGSRTKLPEALGISAMIQMFGRHCWDAHELLKSYFIMCDKFKIQTKKSPTPL